MQPPDASRTYISWSVPAGLRVNGQVEAWPVASLTMVSLGLFEGARPEP